MTKCWLCDGDVLINRRTGKMRKHGFWMSGRIIECVEKETATDAAHGKALLENWRDAYRSRRKKREADEAATAAHLASTPRKKIDFGQPW